MSQTNIKPSMKGVQQCVNETLNQKLYPHRLPLEPVRSLNFSTGRRWSVTFENTASSNLACAINGCDAPERNSGLRGSGDLTCPPRPPFSTALTLQSTLVRSIGMRRARNAVGFNFVAVPVLADSELSTRNQSDLWICGEARESTQAVMVQPHRTLAAATEILSPLHGLPGDSRHRPVNVKAYGYVAARISAPVRLNRLAPLPHKSPVRGYSRQADNTAGLKRQQPFPNEQRN